MNQLEGATILQIVPIIIIPSRRVVREGTPAEVITTWMDYSPGGPPSEVSENIASLVIRQQELQLQNNQDRLVNDPNSTTFGFSFSVAYQQAILLRKTGKPHIA